MWTLLWIFEIIWNKQSVLGYHIYNLADYFSNYHRINSDSFILFLRIFFLDFSTFALVGLDEREEKNNGLHYFLINVQKRLAKLKYLLEKAK